MWRFLGWNLVENVFGAVESNIGLILCKYDGGVNVLCMGFSLFFIFIFLVSTNIHVFFNKTDQP